MIHTDRLLCYYIVVMMRWVGDMITGNFMGLVCGIVTRSSGVVVVVVGEMVECCGVYVLWLVVGG